MIQDAAQRLADEARDVGELLKSLTRDSRTLLRQEVEALVARISVIPGIKDLAMTTNGFLFPQKGEALRQAGLRRVSFRR